MQGLNLKKISYLINLLQYSIGELLFPFLEPVFRGLENNHKEVRIHLAQAIEYIENKKLPLALLSLNAVLSLQPNHFLARVYRGRIFIQLGQFQKASDDYIFADQVSHYRFIHYDLYQEYLRSVNMGIEKFGASIIQNFTQAFETLRQAKEKLIQKEKGKENENSRTSKKSPIQQYLLKNDLAPFAEEGLSDKEMARFEKMGPITQKEVENTDWEKVIKQLTT